LVLIYDIIYYYLLFVDDQTLNEEDINFISKHIRYQFDRKLKTSLAEKIPEIKETSELEGVLTRGKIKHKSKSAPDASMNFIKPAESKVSKPAESKVSKPIVDANEERRLREKYFEIVNQTYRLRPGEKFNVRALYLTIA
jgi:hypothetical protein